MRKARYIARFQPMRPVSTALGPILNHHARFLPHERVPGSPDTSFIGVTAEPPPAKFDTTPRHLIAVFVYETGVAYGTVTNDSDTVRFLALNLFGPSSKNGKSL